MNDAGKILNTRTALVFDLDGTLINTEPDIRRALNDALKECDFEPMPAHMQVPNMHATLGDIVAAVMENRRIPAAAMPDLLDAYAKYYSGNGHVDAQLYPGVLEFLQNQQQRGCVMAVCTNKIRKDALRVLAHCEILPFFESVVGGDTAGHPKPHPAPLLQALQEISMEPQEAVFVGDTYVDALCASHINMDFVHHQAGYGGEKVFEYPANARFMDYRDLLLA